MKNIGLILIMLLLVLPVYCKKANAIEFGVNIEKPWPGQEQEYFKSVKKRIKVFKKNDTTYITIYKPLYVFDSKSEIYYKFPQENPVWSGSDYAELSKIVKFAHKHKIKVQLGIELCFIAKDNSQYKEQWRAYYYPLNPDSFFINFAKEVQIAALFCKKYKIERLNLGQELVSLTTSNYDDNWKKILLLAREQYHGKINYAFNCGKYDENIKDFPDCELYQVSTDFLSYFNEIGITMYPTIEDSSMSSLKKISDFLDKVHRKTMKPLILSETSCPSVKNPLSHDFVGWAWNADSLRQKTESQKDQTQYLKNMFDLTKDKTWLKAIFWHNSYYNSSNPQNDLLMDKGPSLIDSKFRAKYALKYVKKRN